MQLTMIAKTLHCLHHMDWSIDHSTLIYLTDRYVVVFVHLSIHAFTNAQLRPNNGEGQIQQSHVTEEGLQQAVRDFWYLHILSNVGFRVVSISCWPSKMSDDGSAACNERRKSNDGAPVEPFS